MTKQFVAITWILPLNPDSYLTAYLTFQLKDRSDLLLKEMILAADGEEFREEQ